MKKIYSLIGIISIGSVVFAQNDLQKQQVGTIKNLPMDHSTAVAKVNASTDTVDYPTFWGGGQPSIIGLTGGGYAYGVNKYNGAAQGQPPSYVSELAVGQGYDIGPLGYGAYDRLHIIDALVWTGAKEVLSGGQTVTIAIQQLDGTSTYGQNTITCPGAVLGTVTVPYANVDTGSNISSGLTIAHFANPVFVSKKYAVTIDFSLWAANADTLGIVCSGAGGNLDPKYQFVGLPIGAGGAMQWVQTDHFLSGAAIETRSIAAWATFDVAEVGVEGNEYAFGFKLSGYPNPTNNTIKISYAAEKNTSATLEVFSSTGAKVYSNTSAVTAGAINSFDVDTKNFAAGAYYYTVSSDLGRFTKKFSVTK
jgi:hypothetical protein